MDFINLRWILPTLLFVSVAAQANKVSTERVAGTTSYAVKDTTISKPSNTTFSPIRDLNPTPSVQRLPDGGLSQSAKGNLYIAQKNGSKLNSAVNGAFKFAKDNLKGGAKNLLKTNPLSLAGSVGLMGLDKLLRDHGWEPYHDGVDSGFKSPAGSNDPNDYTDLPFQEGIPSSYTRRTHATNSNYNNRTDCPAAPSNYVFVYARVHQPSYGGSSYCHVKSCANNGLIGFSPNGPDLKFCYYGDSADSIKKEKTPVSPDDIDNLVDESYEPHEDDWDKLYPYIYPDSYEIQSVPSVSSSPTITTSTNPSTGDTITTETKTDYDFDVDNSTSTPSITVTETETSTKYENGVKVDETTSVTPHPPTTPLPDSGSGDKPPTFELPSFCSWASVVCNWIGWTQEMPEGDEPDLSRLMNDYEFEQINTISFGSKQCPQPITLNLVLINKPLTVSFDAFCSLAGYLYFMVMASAYIIAARITLGVARG